MVDTQSDKEDGRYRVLQVVDKCAMRGAPIHGVARLLTTWWPAFADSQFPFTLCVLRGYEGGLSEFESMGANIIDLNRGKFDPRTIPDLVRVIRENDIRVIHCHGYGSCTFGRIAASICNISSIVHEHMIDEDMPPVQRLVDLLLSPLKTTGLAVSNAVATFMSEKRSIKRSNIKILYNSIPTNIGKTVISNQKRVIAEEIGISMDQPIVGIVGRLDPIKGHTYFLDAATLVLQENSGAHFVILGAGDLHEELADKVARLGIADNVSFLGHRDNVEDIISSFDVYVSCSLAEGLGIANIEAMALGRPIVAASVGGVPELFEHGVSGILVEPRAPEAMAAAILQIIRDSELGRRLGENAATRYKEAFELSSIVTQLTNVYRITVGLSLLPEYEPAG